MFYWVSEPGNEAADARLRRAASWVFALNALAWGLGGFAALAAGAGRTALPGDSAADTLALVAPWLRPERAYALLRAATGWVGSAHAANLLGAALVSGLAVTLFLCVVRVFFHLNGGGAAAGPRAALRWAFAAGNAVAALFLLRCDTLVAGGFFFRETWDAFLLGAAAWALVSGAVAGPGRAGTLWGLAFGVTLGALCAESPALCVVALLLAALKAVADWRRTGDCFRHLPPFFLAFAVGAGGVFLLACGGWPEGWGEAGAALRRAAAESWWGLRPWLPERWLVVGVLHVLAPALMAMVGTRMLGDRRDGRMLFVAATLGGCLVAEALWAPAGLSAQASAGRPAALPLCALAAVGQGLLLCGLAAWALRPRAEAICGDGTYRLTAAAGMVLTLALGGARLWGLGEDVLRRARLDATLGADAAATFLREAEGRRLVTGTSWMDPFLLMAGEGAPLPLSPVWLTTARGREAFLARLAREPGLAGADAGRLRRMASATWALFLEDVMASAPELRHTALFCEGGEALFRARLTSAPEGMGFVALAEADPLPDPRAALVRQRALWEAFGPRLLRTPSRWAPRVDAGFRAAFRRHLSRMANALGAALEDGGLPAEAFGAYRKALAFDADNVPALLNAYALARAGRAGDLAGAEAVVRDFLAFVRACEQGRRPRTSWAREIALYGPLRNYELMAQIPGDLAGEGLSEALHALLRRAGPDPSVRAWLVRADLHLRRGEVARAEACYQEALRKAPTSLPARHGLARTMLARGNAAGALAMLEEVAGVPGAEALLGDRAACLASLGRWKEARAVADDALRAFPADFTALLLRTLADLRLGGREGVGHHALRRLEASPYHHNLALGEIAATPGPGRDPAEAARRFRAAWVMRPNEDTLLARALTLEVEVGDWAAAEADALFLLRRDPANRAALLALGLLRVREGDDTAALDYLERLVAQGLPLHPIAFVAQSACLVRLGRAREAVAPARRALEANPKALPAAVALAVAQARAGEPTCAEALARVRALDPKGRVPQTVLAEGWVALCLRDAAACRAAHERLARVRDALAGDPESLREAEALRYALREAESREE